MDYKDMQPWQQAADQAEQEVSWRGLPEKAEPGDIYIDDVDRETTMAPRTIPARKWMCVRLIGGANGGRWAYWQAWTKDSRWDRALEQVAVTPPNPEFKAIADTIFNGDAPHFIGMLAKPYIKDAPEKLAWVLIDPKYVPPTPKLEYIEKPETRYEKSKELYDPETHTSKWLK